MKVLARGRQGNVAENMSFVKGSPCSLMEHQLPLLKHVVPALAISYSSQVKIGNTVE